MKTFFVTRRQHDLAISERPNWMRKNWPDLSPRWTIGGAIVTGTKSQIDELRRIIADAEYMDAIHADY